MSPLEFAAMPIGTAVMVAGGIALTFGLMWWAVEIIFKQIKTTALLVEFVKWRVERDRARAASKLTETQA